MIKACKSDAAGSRILHGNERRMRIRISGASDICARLDCTGCAACAQVCPTGCISMANDDEGFPRPVVEAARCAGCGKCIASCPCNKELPSSESSFYMARHKNREVLEKCSSGGVFDALADYVLSRNGSVFGVAMDCSTRDLRHVEVTDRDRLDALRLSKYYQSNVDDAYLRAFERIRDGRQVLFTGTPCQIAGLYSVLGDEFVARENLTTMEVLCHGVGSTKVVEAYLASKARQEGGMVVHYRFRIKEGDKGWAGGHRTRLQLQLPDNTIKNIIDKRNTYMYGFNRNLFLRESCYRCRYCGARRVADFTAADFWGINPGRIRPEELYWGVSLLLASGPKAQSLMPEVRKRMYVEEINPQEAIPYNLALVRAQSRPALRDRFYRDIELYDYDTLLQKYYRKEILVERSKMAVKKVLGQRGISTIKDIVMRLGGGPSELVTRRHTYSACCHQMAYGAVETCHVF